LAWRDTPWLGAAVGVGCLAKCKEKKEVGEKKEKKKK
jgi:hypothetical protein